ncbi:MAG: hypothetical protein EPN84_10915 [Legionella sp.]|nr:MAG: hypothetical protein EPN84_10915 [Legionella sp.]
MKEAVIEMSKKRVQYIERDLERAENTLKVMTQTESAKAKYQSKRFFKSVDLLNYEAELRKEADRITSENAVAEGFVGLATAAV